MSQEIAMPVLLNSFIPLVIYKSIQVKREKKLFLPGVR